MKRLSDKGIAGGSSLDLCSLDSLTPRASRYQSSLFPLCHNRSVKEIPAGLLEEVTARLVEEFDPEAVYLFGSHAWGEPNEDSDLDLFVILSESNLSPAKRGQRAHLSLWGVHAPVDVLVRTRREAERYRAVHASLAAQIFEEGRLLYEQPGLREYPSLVSQSET